MKRVLVIGSSSGLGESFVSEYLDQGYEVVGLGRNANPKVKAHLDLDFTNKESIDDTVKIIQSDYLQFDSMIMCSGIGYIEGLENQSYEHNEQVFNVNLFGPTYFLGQLLPVLKSNKADLVFIGATIGFKANEFMPIYSISKRGLRGLIENIRAALKNECRVFGVHPGGMNTQSNIGPLGRETIIAQKTGKQIGKLMDPTDIAKHIVSLTNLPKNIEIGEVVINKR